MTIAMRTRGAAIRVRSPSSTVSGFRAAEVGAADEKERGKYGRLSGVSR